MLQVVILGEQGSGKTTFLGLLYATQVRSGSDKADDFRFHATFESLDEVTVLFQRLMSGSFPDAATKEGIQEMSFNVGFRRARTGIRSLLGTRRWTAPASKMIHVTLLRTVDQAVSRFLQGSSIASGSLRDVLDSDVVVILVDSTKLAPKGGDPKQETMSKYDADVESIIAAIQRWRERGGRTMLHPVLVLSKFDAVKPEVLRAANVDSTPPRVGKRVPRGTYAKAILGHNLPKTFAILQNVGRGGLRFAPPNYFFSSVRVEGAVPGRTGRIRLRQVEVVGWEPDYSRDEYLAFLEHLVAIAARTEG